MARCESCFVGNLREPVPRTRVQTIIATKDPISNKRAKLQRDGALQLNRQIRDAASRIESMRSCNRTSRACFDATFTCSTAIGDRLIRWQFERRQNLREKEPCPKTFIDQHRVFAMPADTSSRCVIAFQDRPGIHITFLLSAEVAKKRVDLVELAFDNLVVIVPPRIPSDLSLSGGLRCLNLFGLKIIQRQYNDRSRAGQNFLRIATLLFAALHVMHFAVCAFAQPFPKLRSIYRRGANRYATRIETNLLRIRYKTRLQSHSRNLSHDTLAGIADPGSEGRITSLLKIATATSSSVNTDVSRRRCAMFA